MPLPAPVNDLSAARVDLDEHGYCLLELLDEDEVSALRKRVLEQKAAEEQLGISHHLPDKKQLIRFLLNIGQVFRDILFKPTFREMVAHVLGPAYLLSSFHAHLAHPGGSTAFHTDQFWMPPPTDRHGRTPIRPGEITRQSHRGHHVKAHTDRVPGVIAPAFVCNAMWMLDDFTDHNGATIFVPGSHRRGRQPDHALDANENWVAATGPAGTVAVFEGRVWHSTGENLTDAPRIGLTTNFCAPQCRQQENFLLGTSQEVLASASDELLTLIGFKPWQGYGGYETCDEFVSRDQQALGELKPV